MQAYPNKKNLKLCIRLLVFFNFILLTVFFLATNLALAHGAKRVLSSLHTKVEIIIPEDSGASLNPEKLIDLAVVGIERVNSLLSPVGEDSDVAKLNQTPAGEWLKVDPLTMDAVLETARWYQLTEGIFDPTIGPIKQLFKFNGQDVSNWPSSKDLSEVKKKVGLDKLLIDIPNSSLSWSENGMKLDLGGMAKGFAVDLAAEILKTKGVKNAVINAGGEMRILGINPEDHEEQEKPHPRPWRVGLTDPLGEELKYLADISDRAVATSGNYESFFQYKGQRYAHIINPKTGLPTNNLVASVTIIHPTSGTAADILATTMFILGPYDGEKFLRKTAGDLFKNGVEVIMFVMDKDKKLKTILMSLSPDGQLTISNP